MFIKNKSVYKVFIRFYFYIFKKISGKILKTHNDWWGSAVPLRMRTHTITTREPEITGSQIYTTICEEFSMRNGVNSIFDCAGVLICTPSNQIIEVCKQVAK